ncbi:TPA: ATP-binding protein, partial [Escherichia coli]|nr:ATP-binding protein [Escherichia coli]
LKKKKIEIFRSRDDFFEVFRMFFQNGKTLLLSKKNELVMRTEGGTIGLDKLSSGEKQMIILLGEIYLNDNKDIIYIADEPEVSLHVTWQDKIVDALVKINPKAQFILATHSPDIIGRRRESAIRV